MPLTGKDRRFLRGLGRHLTPVVQVGKEGVTPALIAAADQALTDHELIKVKVGENSPLDRFESAEALSEATNSEVAQVLGRTILLYRPDPDHPAIQLPRGSGDGKASAGTAAENSGAESDSGSIRHTPAPISRRMKRNLPHRSSKKALR